MKELKNCPFCGMFSKYVFNGTDGFVECGFCRARGPKFSLSDDICVKDSAIEAWEKRVEENEIST
jgi:hypothetical protein